MRLENEIGAVLNSQNYPIYNIIIETLKIFKFKGLIYMAGIRKECGFSTSKVLTLLVLLPLMTLKNVHQLYQSEYAKIAAMQKDTLYRLKNDERYNWRSLLYMVANMFKKLTAESENGKITALIIDDTCDQRTGYKMEKISYVFDHVLKKSVTRFKILTLSFFDGTSNIPLDFTIHTEKKLERKKAKKQHKKEVDPKSHGAKRRKEAKDTKIEQAIAMIKRAVKKGFVPL